MAVVPNKKFCLVLKFVSLLSLYTSVQAEGDFTVWVNRRFSSDLYQLNSGPHLFCNSTVETYLINENQCASNEELFSGCSYAVTPTRHSSFLIPVAAIGNQSESTITNILDIGDVIEYAVSFSFNMTKQPVNSSFCDISNLKVIRGKKQAIEISHQGFFLNENGSVEIHKNQLTYNTEEYMGELYRMNLFCSGGGLPESGCLFFKVAGRTNTTNDKFNNTVPETLVGIQHYGNLTESPGFTETNITTNASALTMVEPTTEVSILIVGSTLFYTVIGVGGGIIFLNFGFIIVCVLICFSVRRKRITESHTFTTATILPTHNGYEPFPYESPQPNFSERVDDPTLISSNGHLHQPTGDTIANTDNNDYRTGQDRYQVHFFPTEVEYPNTHRQMELIAENNVLEIWSNKDMKQLASSASVQSPEPQIYPTLMDSEEALELSQVYDSVNPKPPEDGAAEGMVYDQLSHTVRHSKQSLPTYLGAAQEYSALGVWKDSPHTKNFIESMPIYDAPDVKIKGQKNEVAMMSSSHKISTCSCPPLPLSIAESRDTDLAHTYAILEQDHSQKSTHTQATKVTESEHMHIIQEQDQLACAQAMETESDHTYGILEQDQVERLSPNEGITSEVDVDHTYAILEQEQLLLHSTHEQTKQTCRILEEEGQTNETWRLNSLQSPESKHERKHSTSRDANFELVQIYNTISPKPPDHEARATEQPSHQACSKKQSLPSYLGARSIEYSAMDIRNAPDVKKKRQRKKTKESEVPNNGEAVMMAASHKVSTTSCPPLALFTESVDTKSRPHMTNGQNPLVSGSFKQKKVHTEAAHTHD